jgi:hypothetical protein
MAELLFIRSLQQLKHKELLNQSKGWMQQLSQTTFKHPGGLKRKVIGK